jgi:hypothetical protein
MARGASVMAKMRQNVMIETTQTADKGILRDLAGMMAGSVFCFSINIIVDNFSDLSIIPKRLKTEINFHKAI